MAVAAILAKLTTELWLSHLNRKHVLTNAGEIPAGFKGMIDEPTYAKSVEYTLARNRFGQFSDTYDTLILMLALFTGVLPWAFDWFEYNFGSSTWVMAAFLLIVGIALSFPSLPVQWLDQFRLEQRFGFNTSTQKTWWLDRVKGLLLTILLGYPLLAIMLKLVTWTGKWWWLWAWGALMAFQLLMTVLAPVLILPLFNKLSPLPEGSLKDRLIALAKRTQFLARGIQVMDGSRRSRHSNAFFTGFGRLRKIVLFDTLIEQLTGPELEAVLAHEIGHYKKKHIPKMMAWSALSSLAGFFAVSVLAQQDWFYRAFGFLPGNIVPALLLFGLLAGVVMFWISPVLHAGSRRFEYEADAYAKSVMEGPDELIGALRKLSEKNLSNLTPHPIYSGFYYSHPALLEREMALKRAQ